MRIQNFESKTLYQTIEVLSPTTGEQVTFHIKPCTNSHTVLETHSLWLDDSGDWKTTQLTDYVLLIRLHLDRPFMYADIYAVRKGAGQNGNLLNTARIEPCDIRSLPAFKEWLSKQVVNAWHEFVRTP